MTDANLTQAEADALLAMEKRRTDTAEWEYPDSGGRVAVPLVSMDGQEQLFLDVRRAGVDLAKGTHQTSAAFCEMLQFMATGTSRSHQRVPPTALRQRTVLSGTPALLAKFGEITMPTLDRVVENRVPIRLSHTPTRDRS